MENEQERALPHDGAPNATAKDVDGSREVVSCSVTINHPTSGVYAFFRDLNNAPLFMEGVDKVTVSGARAHWTARDGDNIFEWDSEITGEVPGREITWRSTASPAASGRATFEEVPGRGTVVTLTISYEQGMLEKLVAKVRQTDPVIRERRNLHRLKQLPETGEIATNARNRKMLAKENH